MKTTPKRKSVKFSFDTSILLSGVSDMYQDLLDGGMDSEEALHMIMGGAVRNYYLYKKYPKWVPIYSKELLRDRVGEVKYEIVLEKLEMNSKRAMVAYEKKQELLVGMNVKVNHPKLMGKQLRFRRGVLRSARCVGDGSNQTGGGAE